MLESSIDWLSLSLHFVFDVLAVQRVETPNVTVTL